MASSMMITGRAAFIFGQDDETEQPSRPAKRRKVSKKATAPVNAKHAARPHYGAEFVPLLNGAEKPEFVGLRQKLFVDAWSAIDARIQNVLRESNRSTLSAVASFVREAPAEEPTKIPAALIVTGPNIASQDLLFEQMAESLGPSVRGRVVRLRSAEAPNLKVTLKKIIRDVTRQASGDEGDAELAVGKDGRKYLDYDLEALHAHFKPHESKQVIVAFQDSEAFDTGLLSDLITLFNSWKDRVSFTLLFGIATSVELFQARLLKSTSQHLYGAQFDVVQTSSVLESIFKAAVAHGANPLVIGPGLLSSLVERQQSQVAGIQVFISSYAYMCHFYGNPLSILLVGGKPQPEHLEALRNLPSFRTHIEEIIEAGGLDRSRSLLDDDAYLLAEQRKTISTATARWQVQLLRSLSLLQASDLLQGDFITTYINALADGINLQAEDSVLNSVKRMPPVEVSSLLERLLNTIKNGNRELGMPGWPTEGKELVHSLSTFSEQIAVLQSQAQQKGKTLRNQHSAQGKVLRTTVVAQKVQLSKDESSLTKEDKAFTELLEKLAGILADATACQPSDTVLFHELWIYESRSPHKDVFTPRPGTVFERALSRPHDYLACTCCGKVGGGNASTLPVTSILYHLYEEAGALVNVADLWSAFYALVGAAEDDGDDQNSEPKTEKAVGNGYDERTALMLFYQGLAELKEMGFVKATKKRADHIAKLTWLW
ncbi:Origin recognition complex subunit 3 [Cytospora mali]|uniref:Origin recognition complex subunit 3 n=1 Tax=Cytospora mali TaxID=578113 RepID=A0A194VRJ4_CYTMA|nr:Origin recognition complex subunit 3 [Valsa mali]